MFALPPTLFKNPLTYLRFMFEYLISSDLRKNLDLHQQRLKEESAYTTNHILQSDDPEFIIT